ncbi:RNA-binding cell elongation regulator Jag/EloR [Desmospora profundinema]|uniref:RNA-binding protein KhpB n=1 Tax=Desmospora profundinema TaxID=1571184 RepID=A0ABU1IMI5_9BACL|nr:RNA-binding cell elongation regulator Jag/EloR [Desmospora profundinema]MDR6225369.1 spoIIIJ-associated protein [Desmospora profundinema]
MKKITVTGKTVDLAVDEALRQLDAERDQVKVTVLEEPQKGFLGWIGSRDAKVEVERLPTPVEIAEQFLSDVLVTMGLDIVQLKRIDEGEQVRFDLSGSELGLLIGRRGQTLDALQYLINIAANRSAKPYTRFVLDAEGYRERRKDTLVELAERIAKQVKRTKKPVTLEPMNPMERKIIHNCIQEQEGVTTTSEGKEPHRKVVIIPASATVR